MFKKIIKKINAISAASKSKRKIQKNDAASFENKISCNDDDKSNYTYNLFLDELNEIEILEAEKKVSVNK